MWKKEGIPRDELIENSASKFLADLKLFNVEPTHFVRTDDPKLLQRTSDVLWNLKNQGLVSAGEMITYHCPFCREDLSRGEINGLSYGKKHATDGKPAKAADQDDPTVSCGGCGEELQPKVTEEFYLSLPREEWLKELLEGQPGKIARSLYRRDFEGNFLKWGFSRPDYFGPSVPWCVRSALYLWFPSIVSKLTAFEDVAWDALPYKVGETSWKMFFGKNITQYYSLILPLVFKYGVGADPLDLALSARGFCSGGDIDIFGGDLNSVIGLAESDDLRLYAAYVVADDVKDFTLRVRHLAEVKEQLIDRLLVGFCRRLFRDYDKQHLFSSRELELSPAFERLRRSFESSSPRRILLDLELIARNWSSESHTDPSRRATAALWIQALSCFMPGKVRRLALEI
jgi:hypothetical protein